MDVTPDRDLARPSGQRFARIGGALCLDLANTVSWRRGAPIDRVPAVDDLLAWCTEAGLAGTGSPRLLPAAVRCREAVYAAFSALAAGGAPPAAAVRQLTRTYAAGVRHASLPPGSDWVWAASVPLEQRLPWEVARSAVGLLRSADCRRVRECGDAQCGWLFLDLSRNASRRWCSSADCGNRDRVRRHYRRTHPS